MWIWSTNLKLPCYSIKTIIIQSTPRQLQMLFGTKKQNLPLSRFLFTSSRNYLKNNWALRIGQASCCYAWRGNSSQVVLHFIIASTCVISFAQPRGRTHVIISTSQRRRKRPERWNPVLPKDTQLVGGRAGQRVCVFGVPCLCFQSHV